MGQFLRLHETPDAFREALRHTHAQSGFSQRLIEKDYYCSVVLADFAPLFSSGLVFKGGTCLSKVHANFYRLSEDLDFTISIATTARRRERREAALPVKRHFEQLAKRLPTISVRDPLQGHNGNRQYNATLQYTSAVTADHETLKVQVAIREPSLEPTVSCTGRTLLRYPVPRAKNERDAGLSLRALSLQETYAEKVRAALTRTPPAIRDFFDLDDAARLERLDLSEPRFVALVQQKLQVVGSAALDVSQSRQELLVGQMQTHLKPVLRSSDYAKFDIARAFTKLEELAFLIRSART